MKRFFDRLLAPWHVPVRRYEIVHSMWEQSDEDVLALLRLLNAQRESLPFGHIVVTTDYSKGLPCS